MKRHLLLILVLGLIAPGAAWAQPEPLGRLFMTPQQRAALDRQRHLDRSSVIDNTAPITLNGRVSRSSGHNTAWINGIPMDERDTAALGRVPLRPGETIGGQEGDVTTDLLKGGTITLKRPAARP